MDKTDIVRKSIKFWFDFFFWQNFYVQFEWQLKKVKLYVLLIRNWKQLVESLKVFPEMKRKYIYIYIFEKELSNYTIYNFLHVTISFYLKQTQTIENNEPITQPLSFKWTINLISIDKF